MQHLHPTDCVGAWVGCTLRDAGYMQSRTTMLVLSFSSFFYFVLRFFFLSSSIASLFWSFPHARLLDTSSSPNSSLPGSSIITVSLPFLSSFRAAAFLLLPLLSLPFHVFLLRTCPPPSHHHSEETLLPPRRNLATSQAIKPLPASPNIVGQA